LAIAERLRSYGQVFIHGAIIESESLQQLSCLRKVLCDLGAILPRLLLTTEKVLLAPLYFLLILMNLLTETLQLLLVAPYGCFPLLHFILALLQGKSYLYELSLEQTPSRLSHKQAYKEANAQKCDACAP
jgi:hypothetical protein